MGSEQGELAGLLSMLIGRQKGCTGQSNSSRSSRESLSDDKNLDPPSTRTQSIASVQETGSMSVFKSACVSVCVHVFMCVFRIQDNVQGQDKGRKVWDEMEWDGMGWDEWSGRG